MTMALFHLKLQVNLSLCFSTYPLIGVWVGPRAGLDSVNRENIPGSAGIRTPVVHTVAWSL